MSGIRWNLLIGFFLLLLAYLQYHLWYEQDGIRDMLSLKQTLNQQIATNTDLKKVNQELLFQIERLQKSEEAIESRARHELGMIKKGETYYQIVNDGRKHENSNK